MEQEEEILPIRRTHKVMETHGVLVMEQLQVARFMVMEEQVLLELHQTTEPLVATVKVIHSDKPNNTFNYISNNKDNIRNIACQRSKVKYFYSNSGFELERGWDGV